MYANTNKVAFEGQIAKRVRRDQVMKKIKNTPEFLAPVKAKKQRIRVAFHESQPIKRSDPQLHFNMASSTETKNRVNIRQWQMENPNDPALKVCTPLSVIKAH
jgi:hypothetical protein